jgi:hypothetical protein
VGGKKDGREKNGRRKEKKKKKEEDEEWLSGETHSARSYLALEGGKKKLKGDRAKIDRL